MAKLSWTDAVREYCKEWQRYASEVFDGTIPLGATDEQLHELREAFDARGLHLDDDIITLLRIVNGTEYDSLCFGGAAIREDDPYGRFDLVRFNDEYNENQSRYTLYGTWDIDLYRFDNLMRKYELLDNGGGGVMNSFATFGELVEFAIRTHVLRPDVRSCGENDNPMD